MTYLVTENCVKCKYTDCVDVCPVDCFYEGPNFLAINPDECIDCGLCEPECPAEAIVLDVDLPEDQREVWMKINILGSEAWPNIDQKTEALPDADEYNRVLNVYQEDKSKEIEGLDYEV